MFSKEEIALLVHTHYQRNVQVSSLPGELDLNFYLIDESGTKLILKIANRQEQLQNLELQNAMMQHLHGKHTTLEIPRLIQSQSNESILIIKDPEGHDRFLRLFTWIEGRPFAKVNPHTPDLLEKVGEMCGRLSQALVDFDHSAAHRFMKWNPSEGMWVKEKLNLFAGEQKEAVDYFFQLFQTGNPMLSTLRKSVTYHDANDYNILVSNDLLNPTVPGVIDFGDATYSHTINELAIAIAYGIMHKPDPLSAACCMVKGFNAQFPIEDDELKLLFTLVCTRLLISVTCSAINLEAEPENTYLQISDKPAWDLLAKLKQIDPNFAYYRFRAACGKTPCPQNEKFIKWAKQQPALAVCKEELTSAYQFDLSVGSLELGNSENIESIAMFDELIESTLKEKNAPIGIGRYNEVRPIYTTDTYAIEGNDGPVWRTVHIGLDVFAKAGTEIIAPLDGTVFAVHNNTGERNYGPTIILEHQVEDFSFYTLYGHLSNSSLIEIKKGQLIKKGEHIGDIGDINENGHWPPHLHFQVVLDILGNTHDFPGVAFAHERDTWTSVCPDPGFLLGLTKTKERKLSKEEILSFRTTHLGKNLSVSYRNPLKMVRGWGTYLLDDSGRRYLDTVNNVAHVGHENARVVKAGQKQMAVLNTNTRYLHDNIIQFTETLLTTLPQPLNVVYLVNSGSEANELALRLAKNHTQATDFIVEEIGYHGNTNACVEVSSYKFDGPGGKGALPHIHVVPMPDTYRGKYRDAEAGKKYALHIKEAVGYIQQSGKKVAGFLCESVLSCGGQIPLPPHYLQEAYMHVRKAGGVCIADEVQTGCGRAGEYFWAFEQQGVVPDIVTIGKPIGNGHPLGVVVTTTEIANSFYNGMEYFNTFGGNPVSSAIGLEVLNVIKEDGLQQRAHEVGKYLTSKLNDLKASFPIIGDVRGPGLFIGIELVEDRQTQEPATTKASYLANRMRELGILMSTDGPFNNVLKIKPPLTFGKKESDLLIITLNRVLKEDPMQPLKKA